jgi:hypothetical protein
MADPTGPGGCSSTFRPLCWSGSPEGSEAKLRLDRLVYEELRSRGWTDDHIKFRAFKLWLWKRDDGSLGSFEEWIYGTDATLLEYIPEYEVLVDVQLDRKAAVARVLEAASNLQTLDGEGKCDLKAYQGAAPARDIGGLTHLGKFLVPTSRR